MTVFIISFYTKNRGLHQTQLIFKESKYQALYNVLMNLSGIYEIRYGFSLHVTTKGKKLRLSRRQTKVKELP